MADAVRTAARGSSIAVSAEDGVVYRLTRGTAEAYAFSDEKETTQQKYFLAELHPGDCCFPPATGRIEYELYALSDIEVVRISVSTISGEELARMWRGWFSGLSGLSGMEPETADTPERVLDARRAVDAALRQRFQSDEQKGGEQLAARRRVRGRAMADALSELASGSSDGDGGVFSQSDDALEFVVRIVADRFGMDREFHKIPADVAASLDGLSLLRRTVNRAGMRVRLITLENIWWKTDSGPMLGYYGPDKTLVALLPENERRYRLHSLEQPGGIPVTASVAEQIDASAFAVYPGFSRRILTVRETALFLLRQTWRMDWRTIVVASLLGGLLALAPPLIIENIFSGIVPMGDRGALGTVVQVMLVTGFAAATLKLVRAVASARIGMRLATVLDGALWSRLLSLPANFFRQYPVGDLANRLNSGRALLGFISGELAGVVFDLTFSLLSLILMFVYSWKLSLIAIGIWIVSLALGFLVRRRFPVLQRDAIAASNAQSARVIELLNGLPAFRVRGGEEQAFYRWAESFAKLWRAGRAIRVAGNRASLLGVVQPVALAMIMYWAALRLTAHQDGSPAEISHAGFLAFQTLYAGFNATVAAIPDLVISLLTNRSHIDNVRPILEETPEMIDAKPDAGVLKGAIELKSVSFRYDPDSPQVLRDVSLKVEPGQSVALVGPSGCGKSTLIRLLLGFEKPERGGVYYDGLDLAGLNAASVRAQMGVVLQNGMLMADDIRTNITGTTALTMDDAWAAAEKVGLKQDIEEMPMGMFTQVSEGGGNISGGQRQRILIARAIVSNPSIIIFDEATSALDNVTQAIVTECLSSMRATRICVAHRLSTIRDADVIFVMDEGRIIEAGTYNELMERNGLFRLLAERQL